MHLNLQFFTAICYKTKRSKLPASSCVGCRVHAETITLTCEVQMLKVPFNSHTLRTAGFLNLLGSRDIRKGSRFLLWKHYEDEDERVGGGEKRCVVEFIRLIWNEAYAHKAFDGDREEITHPRTGQVRTNVSGAAGQTAESSRPACKPYLMALSRGSGL